MEGCGDAHAGGRGEAEAAEGRRAGLAAFAEDPLTTAATDLPDLPVLLTVLDGRITHRAATV